MFLEKFLGKQNKKVFLSKEEIASLLKTCPEMLEAFEKSYEMSSIEDVNDNIFKANVKEFSDLCIDDIPEELDDIVDRIVNNLVSDTVVYRYENGNSFLQSLVKEKSVPVSLEEIKKFPIEYQPQLTESLMKVDVDSNSSAVILTNYKNYLEETNEKKKRQWYHLFRQGLDISDLDPITYEILGMNRNNMGYWLPKIAKEVGNTDFFKIPATTVIKVPLPVLQLTRTDYFSLTPTTKSIVNKYCQKVFELNSENKYFIKTGTHSSKFDFRNACITSPNEVLEIGEYLLFIQFQASQMASPLTMPKSIYGVSTTNEWVVREYIEDVENNPTIYHGLPLHTEYRLFVDFDRKEIIGAYNYWDSNVMKNRFGNQSDKDEPDNVHDYIIYSSHEDVLYKRYNENKDKVVSEMKKLVSKIDDLSGQWSIDVMQNGNEFWIIDMAVAEESAFYEFIPEGLRKKSEENWLPVI